MVSLTGAGQERSSEAARVGRSARARRPDNHAGNPEHISSAELGGDSDGTHSHYIPGLAREQPAHQRHAA